MLGDIMILKRTFKVMSFGFEVTKFVMSFQSRSVWDMWWCWGEEYGRGSVVMNSFLPDECTVLVGWPCCSCCVHVNSCLLVSKIRFFIFRMWYLRRMWVATCIAGLVLFVRAMCFLGRWCSSSLCFRLRSAIWLHKSKQYSGLLFVWWYCLKFHAS